MTIWPWLALLLALAIGSPSLVGQYELGFPVLQQMEDLREVQLERVTPTAFLLGQLYWGPGTLLAAAGLRRAPRRETALALPRDSAGAAPAPSPYCCSFRGSRITWARCTPHCSAPGPCWWSGAGCAGPPAWPSSRTVRCCCRSVCRSCRPPEWRSTSRPSGLTDALRTNTGELGRLPQDFADMLGWEEQVEAVARVYRELPAGDRERAVIIGGNYGEAGAIDFFGPRYGLPGAVCPCGSYWFFGPGERPGRSRRDPRAYPRGPRSVLRLVAGRDADLQRMGSGGGEGSDGLRRQKAQADPSAGSGQRWRDGTESEILEETRLEATCCWGTDR